MVVPIWPVNSSAFPLYLAIILWICLWTSDSLYKELYFIIWYYHREYFCILCTNYPLYNILEVVCTGGITAFDDNYILKLWDAHEMWGNAKVTHYKTSLANSSKMENNFQHTHLILPPPPHPKILQVTLYWRRARVQKPHMARGVLALWSSPHRPTLLQAHWVTCCSLPLSQSAPMWVTHSSALQVSSHFWIY